MPRSRSSDTIKSSHVRKDADDSSNSMQFFEKPTQIYRYLKTRLIKLPPLFLQRNLAYMKGRSTRKNGLKRQSFKVDELNLRLEEAKLKDRDSMPTSENLVIAFVRFDDARLESNKVEVKTKLEKMSHKRRKDAIDTQPMLIGSVSVCVNADDPGEDLPAVCVANDKFESSAENINITYQLTFDIEADTFTRVKNGDEPPSKSQCLQKKYHAELPVFDKSGRNLLLNGLYQVSAVDPQKQRPSCGPQHWETLESEQRIQNWAEEVNKHFISEEDTNPFIVFDNSPKIQIYMEWKREKMFSKSISRPVFLNELHLNNNKENSCINVPNENGQFAVQHKLEAVDIKKTTPYAYQFVMPNSKQRFKERTDFICPWCSLNCIRMYSLMKHLKLCHSRFLFQLVNEVPIQRIDVYVNELYDGSYSGAPHDVLLGSQRGPTRRTVVTSIMVFHPRRPTYNLSEFQEADDGELDQQRQYISGHNRIYYHSETCIPIMPKELEYDSEGEPDPKWLQRTTKQMIDEFSDVNAGEKELMKLWNLHVMKHGFVGDCQIQLACELFLKEKGQELVEKNLSRNYIAHLHALFNYGLISPRQIDENIKSLIEIQKTVTDPIAMKKGREQGIASWIKREKALSPLKNSMAKGKSSSTPKALPKIVEPREKNRKRSSSGVVKECKTTF